MRRVFGLAAAAALLAVGACGAQEPASMRIKAPELEGIEDLLQRGNGASRQIVVYEANHDLREVVSEIVDKTSA